MELSQRIIAYMRKEAYKPMTAEELAPKLAGSEKKKFYRALEALEKSGAVVKTRYGRYGVPEKMNLVVGKVQGHSHGYAFLLPEKPGPDGAAAEGSGSPGGQVASQVNGDGAANVDVGVVVAEYAIDDSVQEDVFLPPTKLNGALHNDRVVVRLLGRGGANRRAEGEVIRILQRANEYIVGTFDSHKRMYFVTPDDPRLGTDIAVPRNGRKGASPGEKVVVRIEEWPQRRKPAVGRVHAILGRSGDPAGEMEAIMWQYGLPSTFPPAVEAEAAALPVEVGPAELRGRRDLRGAAMVTIDGEDAKDLDDAVSLEIDGDIFRLGVHIADVSYYVREGSALDKEAYNRATSTYLVDRVVPMLPRRLSNNICSLNPKVDRLAMSISMDIDSKGHVTSHEIFPSVINTNERMTYTAVRKILTENDKELSLQYSYLVDTFKNMEKLALILKERRRRRGSVDFNFPEAKVILNEEGKPVAIDRRDSSIAEQIIEEFMLVANETIAQHFDKLQVPFVYRVHEEPSGEKITALQLYLDGLGVSLKPAGKDVTPKDVQALVDKVAGRPEERAVNTLILRSLREARYAPTNLGHFGLAARHYCHFTSPIRRYPDLVIHRIIREVLESGELSEKRRSKLKEFVPGASRQSSERERAAMEAERESIKLAMCLYMKEHLEEEYDGVISGVKSFGFFVELPNLVEGLVHVTTLTDDFYIYEESKMSLTGQHLRKIFRLGDRIRVRVVKSDPFKREIDFELVD